MALVALASRKVCERTVVNSLTRVLAACCILHQGVEGITQRPNCAIETVCLASRWPVAFGQRLRTQSKTATVVALTGTTARPEPHSEGKLDRQALCINPAVAALGSAARINEACTDLQRAKTALKKQATEAAAGEPKASLLFP